MSDAVGPGGMTEPECWAVLERFVPRVLPAGWRCLETACDGAKWAHVRTGQTVIASVDREADGRVWLHLSTALPARLPTYDELAFVKDTWVGREATALQVFAPRSKHVNQHPHCLHLWHCVDGDVTPDFTRGGASL